MAVFCDVNYRDNHMSRLIDKAELWTVHRRCAVTLSSSDDILCCV